MKLCSKHSEALFGAIQERGLGCYVPTHKTRMSFSHAMMLQSQIRKNRITGLMVLFSPFTNASKSIVNNAIRLGELEISVRESDACPICHLQAQCTCGSPECKAGVENWVQLAADDQLQQARDLGLVGET